MSLSPPSTTCSSPDGSGKERPPPLQCPCNLAAAVAAAVESGSSSGRSSSEGWSADYPSASATSSDSESRWAAGRAPHCPDTAQSGPSEAPAAAAAGAATMPVPWLRQASQLGMLLDCATAGVITLGQAVIVATQVGAAHDWQGGMADAWRLWRLGWVATPCACM